MASIRWANNHQKPLTNSVVFSNTNAPSNVALDKFLQPAVQYVPAGKTNSRKKAKRPIQLVYTNSFPTPPCPPIAATANANTTRRHEACMRMMANRREKRKKSEQAKIEGNKTRKARKAYLA